MNIFEQAARNKLRFETTRGQMSVEDLWDLPLTTSKLNGVSLDSVAVGLHTALKETETVSFVEEDKKSEDRAEMQLRFDLAKHILDVRIAENKAAREKAEKASKKQQLLEVLSRKEDAALESKSAEEIREMIAAL